MRRLALLAVVVVVTLTACTPQWIANDVWRSHGKSEAEIAQSNRVMSCESGFNPNARNGPYQGLFQLHHRHASLVGGANLFDPYWNALAALHLYNGSGGWYPWGCRP